MLIIVHSTYFEKLSQGNKNDGTLFHILQSRSRNDSIQRANCYGEWRFSSGSSCVCCGWRGQVVRRQTWAQRTVDTTSSTAQWLHKNFSLQRAVCSGKETRLNGSETIHECPWEADTIVTSDCKRQQDGFSLQQLTSNRSISCKFKSAEYRWPWQCCSMTLENLRLRTQHHCQVPETGTAAPFFELWSQDILEAQPQQVATWLIC